MTGATGGLGRAMAAALRAEGADLVVTGRRAEPLRQLAAEVQGTAVVADLADAGKRALEEKKLLFVLNISGNFEDDKFT